MTKLVSIAPSELAYYGRSARFIDGEGWIVDERCMKRRKRKTLRQALRQQPSADDGYISDVWGYGTPKRR